MSEDDPRRKDDSFLRKVATGVVIAWLAQGALGLYFIGTLSGKMDSLFNNMVVIMTEQSKQNDILLAVVKEQSRRTTIVEDARDFMRDRKRSEDNGR